MPEPVTVVLKLGVAAIFAAGVAWGTTQLTVRNMSAQIDRIDKRVAEMYCAQVPAAQRPGCR